MSFGTAKNLREKFFSYSIGRIRNPSLVNDSILPLKLDYTSASFLSLKNVHAVRLFSSVLLYHPYGVVKYRLHSVRSDPTGKHHTVTDEGTYIVDALDGDVINQKEGLLTGLAGLVFKSKEKRIESKEDKIVTEDILTIKPISQTVMKTFDYDVSVAEPSVTEEDASRIVRGLVIEKNTRNVYYDRRMIAARDEAEMERKALARISDFWGEGTRQDAENKYLFWNPDQTENIALDSSQEIHGLDDVIGKLGVGGDFF